MGLINSQLDFVDSTNHPQVEYHPRHHDGTDDPKDVAPIHARKDSWNWVILWSPDLGVQSDAGWPRKKKNKTKTWLISFG